MQQINDELLMSQKNHELMLRVLLSQLLLKLVRGADNTVRGGGSLNQAQRQWLREFARDNMQRRHSIKELANGVRLSPDYFCRVFRQTYGVTPSRWMLQERMQAAGRLLHESTLNISEVSERFGYTDVALFSRQFKEIIGTSPLRFRSAHG